MFEHFPLGKHSFFWFAWFCLDFLVGFFSIYFWEIWKTFIWMNIVIFLCTLFLWRALSSELHLLFKGYNCAHLISLLFTLPLLHLKFMFQSVSNIKAFLKGSWDWFLYNDVSTEGLWLQCVLQCLSWAMLLEVWCSIQRFIKLFFQYVRFRWKIVNQHFV